MNFELTIRGDSFEEIASIFSTRTTIVKETANGGYAPVETEEASEPSNGEDYRAGRPELRAKEVEPEIEAPAKATRTRRAKAEKTETAGEDGNAAPEKVTFEDIRALASSLMDSGKVEARAIQDMLVAKFDARAFGALKEEQYADCLAELQNLG